MNASSFARRVLYAALVASGLASAAWAAEPVPVEVRVDLRADRSVQGPMVRLSFPNGADPQIVLCNDEAIDGDAVRNDRLWLCRGELDGEGTARLVLLAGAGGTAEQELAALNVELVPGRTLRWAWKAGARAWTADDATTGLSEQQRAAASMLSGGAPVAPGGALSGSPPEGSSEPGNRGPPRPPGTLDPIFAQPIARDLPTDEVVIPTQTVMPPWPVWLAMPGLLAAVVALRAALAAVRARVRAA